MVKRIDKIFEVGELPKLGELPNKMHAWTIRQERFGEPTSAYKEEIIDVPKPGKRDVIVANMVTGVNYNGIWAALGKPVNVLKNKYHHEDFHICGSETSGIVYEVGEDVTEFKVGDKVIIQGTQYDENCPIIKSGQSPLLSPTFHIWGYESNWGGFAQFSKVMVSQCILKPECLDWVEAATSVATGVTAYRMLRSWKENQVNEGDVVLIWGGAGGVGSIAISIVKHFGGIPIAVVSSEEHEKICMQLGAKGCINRKEFNHWGPLNDKNTGENEKKWLREALKFRRKIWDIVGERKSPKIVFEHVGEDTLPTSIFVCDRGGMVVICGGTTGYLGSLDLRYLWLEQKRLQGSHAATQKECEEYVKFIEESNIRPYIGKVYSWDETAQAHQDLYLNKFAGGKLAVKISCK